MGFLWAKCGWLSICIPLGYQFDTTSLPLNYYLVLSPYPFTYLSLASTVYTLHFSPFSFLFLLPKERLKTSIDTSKRNNHIKTPLTNHLLSGKGINSYCTSFVLSWLRFKQNRFSQGSQKVRWFLGKAEAHVAQCRLAVFLRTCCRMRYKSLTRRTLCPLQRSLPVSSEVR